MSHRYRLCPTPDQEQVLALHCRDARYVWNIAVEQDKHARVLGQHADQKQWDKNLSEARQAFGWLAEGSSSVQQAALRDLRQAYRNWWGNPAHFRPPTWRREGVSDGFAVRDLTVTRLNRKWAELVVPKAGRVRFRLSRPLPEGAKSARVTLDRSGRWHVSMVAVPDQVEGPGTGEVVGIDRGVVVSYQASDGRSWQVDGLKPAERRRLRLLQRRMARQQKGSARRERTRLQVARLKAREADRRKDAVEKATTELARTADIVRIEDLKVGDMTRSARGTVDRPGRNVAQKRGLNRSIQSVGWATFEQRLGHKIGARLERVPAAFSSQECHECGHTAKENRESQAVFRCQGCGFTANADLNAALVVRDRAAGHAVPGRGGNVRPPLASAGAGSPGEASTTPEAAGASHAA